MLTVRRAMEDPYRWIANNAGWEGAIVLDKIKNNKEALSSATRDRSSKI